MIQHNLGIVKYKQEDFIVKEKVIIKSTNGKNYSLFILKRNNCSLFNSLMRLSKIMKLPISRFHFFGEKDKYAVTTQLIWTPKLRFLEERIVTRDFELIYLFDVKEIDTSWMLGNKFKITVRKIAKPEMVEERIKKLIDGKVSIPNYYDIQRFGKRRINHIIGYYLLNSKYYEASYLFLCIYSKNENHKVKKIRRKLNELFVDGSFKIDEAIGIKMPQYMDVEKIFLRILSKTRNFKKAWKEFPSKWTSLFKESYYSYTFNKSIAQKIKTTTKNYFTYEYPIDVPPEFDSFLAGFEKKIELVYPLEKLDIRIGEKIKNREIFLNPVIYSYDFRKDDMFEGYYRLDIEFFLGRGSFATNLLTFILGG